MERPEQERTFASRNPIGRRWNPLDDVRMTSLSPFLPPAVDRFPHWVSLFLVDFFGAFGIVVDEFPSFIFEIVSDFGQLNSSTWNKNIGGILSNCHPIRKEKNAKSGASD